MSAELKSAELKPNQPDYISQLGNIFNAQKGDDFHGVKYSTRFQAADDILAQNGYNPDGVKLVNDMLEQYADQKAKGVTSGYLANVAGVVEGINQKAQVSEPKYESLTDALKQISKDYEGKKVNAQKTLPEYGINLTYGQPKISKESDKVTRIQFPGNSSLENIAAGADKADDGKPQYPGTQPNNNSIDTYASQESQAQEPAQAAPSKYAHKGGLLNPKNWRKGGRGPDNTDGNGGDGKKKGGRKFLAILTAGAVLATSTLGCYKKDAILDYICSSRQKAPIVATTDPTGYHISEWNQKDKIAGYDQWHDSKIAFADMEKQNKGNETFKDWFGLEAKYKVDKKNKTLEIMVDKYNGNDKNVVTIGKDSKGINPADKLVYTNVSDADFKAFTKSGKLPQGGWIAHAYSLGDVDKDGDTDYHSVSSVTHLTMDKEKAPVAVPHKTAKFKKPVKKAAPPVQPEAPKGHLGELSTGSDVYNMMQNGVADENPIEGMAGDLTLNDCDYNGNGQTDELTVLAQGWNPDGKLMDVESIVLKETGDSGIFKGVPGLKYSTDDTRSFNGTLSVADGGKVQFLYGDANPDEIVKHNVKINYEKNPTLGQLLGDFTIHFKGADGKVKYYDSNVLTADGGMPVSDMTVDAFGGDYKTRTQAGKFVPHTQISPDGQAVYHKQGENHFSNEAAKNVGELSWDMAKRKITGIDGERTDRFKPVDDYHNVKKVRFFDGPLNWFQGLNWKAEAMVNSGSFTDAVSLTGIPGYDRVEMVAYDVDADGKFDVDELKGFFGIDDGKFNEPTNSFKSGTTMIGAYPTGGENGPDGDGGEHGGGNGNAGMGHSGGDGVGTR